MIKRVLRAMKTGDKAVFSKSQLLEALDGDIQNCTELGFSDFQPVFIFNKRLQEEERGYILFKSLEPGDPCKWVRNPRKYLELMSKGEGLYLTAGVPDVLAFGKGLVTSCRRGGFNIKRTAVVIALGPDRINDWPYVFRGYYVERIYE